MDLLRDVSQIAITFWVLWIQPCWLLKLYVLWNFFLRCRSWSWVVRCGFHTLQFSGRSSGLWVASLLTKTVVCGKILSQSFLPVLKWVFLPLPDMKESLSWFGHFFQRKKPFFSLLNVAVGLVCLCGRWVQHPPRLPSWTRTQWGPFSRLLNHN